jgi:hypothetical protein
MISRLRSFVVRDVRRHRGQVERSSSKPSKARRSERCKCPLLTPCHNAPRRRTTVSCSSCTGFVCSTCNRFRHVPSCYRGLRRVSTGVDAQEESLDQARLSACAKPLERFEVSRLNVGPSSSSRGKVGSASVAFCHSGFNVAKAGKTRHGHHWRPQSCSALCNIA